MSSLIRRSRLVAQAAVLFSILQPLTACSSPAAERDAESAESAVTTELFGTASIAEGASRTGVWTSTVSGEITLKTSGTGDADLYVKKRSAPSSTVFDAKSDGPTSTEQVKLTVAVGDKVHYRVYAYAASTVSLSLVTAEATIVELVPSGSMAKNAAKAGVFKATVAGEHAFRSSGAGDVDLYLNKDALASSTSNDARSDGPNANEEVRINLAVGEEINWQLFAFASSTASLVVALPANAWSGKLYLPTLTEAPAFAALSTAGGGLSTTGRSIKFLIDVDTRTASARSINFLNGNYVVNGRVPEYAKYHYDFARNRYGIGDSIATFNDSTYFTQRKSFFAGTIQTYVLGESTQPTYAIQFYPDDVIAEESILEAIKAVRASFLVPGARLVFVATGKQQTFARIGAQAAALGVDLLTIDQVLGNIKYVALNRGEGWGYLRIFPTDTSTLRPTDIAVFDDLPLDLSVVAGTITKAYQDVNSHVNLKSKERNTPNMVLRDASPTHERLKAFADKPVHFVVKNDEWLLEPTTPAVIDQKLRDRLSGPWIRLPIVDDTRLVSFDESCPSASASCFTFAKAFGGKTQGLGFLAGALGRVASPSSVSAPFGYDLSPHGFGIPVKAYRDFMAAPENAAIKAKVDELIAAEKGGNLAPAERNAKVAEVQALFYKGFVPGTLVADVTARLTAVLPGVEKLKFRSSATSEDVSGFNGAGLYDSFAIEPAKKDNPDFSCVIESESDGVTTKLKVKPKSVQCGIKVVFASLWNSRAIVERTFGRLDHATAGMGIAVNPSYGDELANLVLVTRVTGTDAIYGYTLSVQKGENLVTNPIPGTITEFDVASFSDPGRPPRITTTRYAKPTVADAPLTTTILTDAQMADLVDVARKVETAYCRAKPAYYPGGDCSRVWLDVNKPVSLDMEIKILPNGNYQWKQVREFHGR